MQINQPPSTLTGPLRDYLVQIATALNGMPEFSYFTTLTPSLIQGSRGDMALYNGSLTTVPYLWVKTSLPASENTLSWGSVTVTP